MMDELRPILLGASGILIIQGLLLVVYFLIRRTRAKSRGHREASLYAMFRSLPIPVFAFNQYGHCLFCNNAYAEPFLGCTAQEATGKDVRPMLSPSQYKQWDQCQFACKALAEEPGSHSVEAKLYHHDGICVEYRMHRATLLDEHGEANGVVTLFFDIDQHKRTESELLQLKRVMEATADSVVVTDKEGTILDVNPSFTTVTGWERDEVLGKNPRILKSGKQDGVFYRKLWECINHGEVFSGLVTNKRKDGSEFEASLTIAPIHNEDNERIGFVGVQHDVTELVAARVLAEESMEAKSQFLANMSHEIRTPMNGVIGMTSLLLETKLNEEQLEFANTIRMCAESLLTIINDILDFSKIDAGKLEMEQIDFNLRRVVEDVVDMMIQRVHAKGLNFHYLVHPEVHAPLVGDPSRLRQILVNLIGNAIKFTSKGEVHIEISCDSETDTHAVVRFAVRDTGIGIPADRLDRLFDSFSQVDASTTRHFGGTGLGLAISKRLVEMMGGVIGVESTMGEGSTFWFTASFPKQEAPEQLPADAQNVLRGMRVLLIEPDTTNQQIVSAYLDSWGVECLVSSQLEATIDLLQEASAQNKPIQVAIIDAKAPELEDLEVIAKRVKEFEQDGYPKLVLLTDYGRRGDAATARKMGFDGYLTKPIKPSQLQGSLLLLKNKQTPAAKPEKQSLVTRHSIEEAQESSIRILLAEDNIVNQRVAERMLKKLGYSATLVNDGAKALAEFEQNKYDIILMDVQMPEVDGLEATARIRELEDAQTHTPIIAMTAHAMKGDRERCLEAGMDDYLSKPVKLEELGEKISTWASNKMFSAD